VVAIKGPIGQRVVEALWFYNVKGLKAKKEGVEEQTATLHHRGDAVRGRLVPARYKRARTSGRRVNVAMHNCAQRSLGQKKIPSERSRGIFIK